MNIVQNVRVVHAIHSVEEPPGAQMVTLDVSEDEGSKIMNAVGRLFFIRQDMAR
ncbi:hypothetical protein D3C84_1222360 [compost metagenome]